MKKVVLGMSGGVDSSVTAYLLKERGYEVIGVTMALIDEKHSCREANISDARAVCEKLGIEFKVLHFEDVFEEEIVNYFLNEYKAGRTPNPCVMCNKKIKFNRLLEAAMEMGADYLATGHYAKIVEENGRYSLMRASDDSKDQSYFLYNLRQDQLSKILMPLSEYTKEEVRKIAENIGLTVAHKKDSEDICFIPDRDSQKFIKERIGADMVVGDFVDSKGNVIGKHEGIENYTIGQRKGLGLSMGKKVFVKGIDAKNKRVVIGEEEELYSKVLWVKDVNFISIDKLSEPIDAQVKIRYSKAASNATISREGDRIKITFLEPQRAATLGQAAVFYQGDYVLGGGIIEGVE